MYHHTYCIFAKFTVLDQFSLLQDGFTVLNLLSNYIQEAWPTQWGVDKTRNRTRTGGRGLGLADADSDWRTRTRGRGPTKNRKIFKKK